MTEDDTFRILSRPPFEQMYDLVENWTGNLSDKRNIDEFLKHYGWNYKQYAARRAVFWERVNAEHNET